MTKLKISQMPPAGKLTGAEIVPLVQAGVNVQDTLDNIKTFVGGENGNGDSGSHAYGYSLNEQTRTYTKLGVNSHAVHDQIRQCLLTENGEIPYFLNRENGWDKENRKPSRRFTDPDQSEQNIDTVISQNSFTSTLMGQGISNSRGEYAIITNVESESLVAIDEIAPVHKVYGKNNDVEASHLKDSTTTFANVEVGDIVHNRITGEKARITTVSEYNLTLDDDIFLSTDQFYSIYSPFLGDNEVFYLHTAVVNGDDGDVMVRIPKFYYKYDFNEGTHSWMISDKLEEGFEVHPAFVVGEDEVDFFAVGAFEGWLQGINGDSVLRSIAGQYPSASKTRAEFRAAAALKSANHSLRLWYQHYALQLLYITYFGDWDAQKIIGEGMTSFNADYFGNWSIGEISGTGATTKTGIALKNGVKTASEFADANDPTAYMSMFGIEHFYGNLFEWIDGANVETSTGKVYVSNNPADLADDISVNYTDIEIILPYDRGEDQGEYWGYITSLFASKHGIIAATVSGEEEPLIADGQGAYYEEGMPWAVVGVGGDLSYGVFGGGAGVAYLYANVGSSFTNPFIGSRLCFSGKQVENGGI